MKYREHAGDGRGVPLADVTVGYAWAVAVATRGQALRDCFGEVGLGEELVDLSLERDLDEVCTLLPGSGPALSTFLSWLLLWPLLSLELSCQHLLHLLLSRWLASSPSNVLHRL